MPAREPRDAGTRIAANPTDGGGYRRGAGKSPRRPDGGAAPSRSIGLTIFLTVLVAGLGLAGWFIANQQQMLADSRANLESATQRIVQLEGRLLETDQTMSATGVEVNDKFKLWESEIRKLWDVANKRNVDMIKAAETKLTTQSAEVDGLQTSLKALNATVGKHEEAFGQQGAVMDQIAAMELQMRKVVEAQRKTTDQIAATQKSVSSLETGLLKRVQDNEKAIEAIDAYRLQLNAKLNEINGRLQAIAQPAG